MVIYSYVWCAQIIVSEHNRAKISAICMPKHVQICVPKYVQYACRNTFKYACRNTFNMCVETRSVCVAKTFSMRVETRSKAISKTVSLYLNKTINQRYGWILMPMEITTSNIYIMQRIDTFF